MHPAFESKKEGGKGKWLKRAEIRAGIKPLVQSAKIHSKGKKGIKRSKCRTGPRTLLPTSPGSC